MFCEAILDRGTLRYLEIEAIYHKVSPSSFVTSSLSSLETSPFLSRMSFLILSAVSPASPTKPKIFSINPGSFRSEVGLAKSYFAAFFCYSSNFINLLIY